MPTMHSNVYAKGKHSIQMRKLITSNKVISRVSSHED